MDAYFQDTDIKILLEFFRLIDDKTVVDVGAEKGQVADSFVNAGASAIYAFEPYQRHAESLRQRFAARPQVKVMEIAIGSKDQDLGLNIAQGPDGNDLDYFHSVHSFSETADVTWGRRVKVSCRSLSSLVAEGSLPQSIGILKVDTEGNDFDVICGMGSLESSVVMVEYWDGLEFGPCPYDLVSMVDTLQQRGFSNYAFIKRHDEFQTVQINSFESRQGDWGNVVFIHDRAFPRLAPVLYKTAAESGRTLVEKAHEYRTQCQRRLEVIDQLKEAAERNLEVIRTLEESAARHPQRTGHTLVPRGLGAALAVARLFRNRR